MNLNMFDMNVSKYFYCSTYIYTYYDAHCTKG